MNDFQNEDLDLIFANKKGKSLMLLGEMAKTI